MSERTGEGERLCKGAGAERSKVPGNSAGHLAGPCRTLQACWVQAAGNQPGSARLGSPGEGSRDKLGPEIGPISPALGQTPSPPETQFPQWRSGDLHTFLNGI